MLTCFFISSAVTFRPVGYLPGAGISSVLGLERYTTAQIVLANSSERKRGMFLSKGEDNGSARICLSGLA